MQYKYRVRDQQGRLKVGVVEAESQNIVAENLQSQGGYIVYLKESSLFNRKLRLFIDQYTFNKVSIRDLAILTRQLSAMLTAGIPILNCFKVLEVQTGNKTLKNAVAKISKDIDSGHSIWESLAKHPRIFSQIYISMVRAGELGGVLAPVMERLIGHLEREQEINTKLKSASIYPGIVAGSAIITMLFIISFVMPIFVGVFASSGVQLPVPTLVLLKIGDFLSRWWASILIGTIVSLLSIKWWVSRGNGKYVYDLLILNLPFIGKTVRRVAAARFTRTLSTLIGAGIQVVEALEVAEGIADNAVLGKAIAQARSRIKEGETMAKSFMQTGMFEIMVPQMIAAGEETGSLDVMLMHISDYYERELTYTIDAMLTILEPLLILAVALIVGGVVIATLLPMLDMMNLVGL